MVSDRSNGIYRGLVLAFGLILTAASQPPKVDRQQPTNSAPAKVERSLEDMSASLREANKTSDLEQPCEEGDNKRSSDLCAQWKAADAAEKGAGAAWLFGALGTLIGAFTLAAASAAAYFAKKAADHTKEGVEVAQSVAEGYVIVQNPILTITKKVDGWDVALEATATNVGQTATYAVAITADIMLIETLRIVKVIETGNIFPDHILSLSSSEPKTVRYKGAFTFADLPEATTQVQIDVTSRFGTVFSGWKFKRTLVSFKGELKPKIFGAGVNRRHRLIFKP